MVAGVPNPLERNERLETISKCVDPIPLLNTVDTRKSMETVACTSSASAQISSISDSDVPQTSAQVPYLGTGVSSANEAYCYGDPAGTLFVPHSPQLFADPSLGVFTPGPQFPSLGATPWDFPPRPPGALLPWW